MSTFHKKLFYINTEKNWVSSSRYTRLIYVPVFTYNDHYELEFHIQNNNRDYYDLSGYNFKFGLDYNFATTHNDLVTSTNFDLTNASNGIVKCYLNCRSNSLLTYLDDDKSKTGYAVLWALKAGEPNQLLTQFNCSLGNICGDIDDELSSYSSSSSSSIDSSSSNSSSSYSSSSNSSSSSSIDSSSSSSSSSVDSSSSSSSEDYSDSSEGYSSESSSNSSSSSVNDLMYEVTGSIVPPNFTGTYSYYGIIDSHKSYTNGVTFLYYYSVASRYLLANNPDFGSATIYFGDSSANEDPVGTYDPLIGCSGNPVVSLI